MRRGMFEIPEADTYPKLLKRSTERWGNKVAMRKKDRGIWREYTWNECYQRTKYFSLGLISLGLKPGDKVAIIGENEPEWFWAEFGTQAAGGVPTGIFTDSIPSEVKYITDNSDAKFIVVHDQEQVDKLLLIKNELPKGVKVIYWDPKGLRNYDDPILLSFEQVEERGKEYEETHRGLFEENIEKTKGEDIAFIYYTSGTSGLPKGAMVSHNALITSASSYLEVNPCMEEDDRFSYFSAAWIGEGMITTTPHLITGVKLNFAEEPETVQEDMREIGPQTVAWGSRQWEQLASTMEVKIRGAAAIKRLLYRGFLRMAYNRADFVHEGKRPNWLWRIVFALGDAIVFKPLRDKLGLLHCRIATTGGSYLSIDTIRLWSAIGINVKQAFGGTEAGLVSAHASDDIRFDTVGCICPFTTVRLNEDSEILVRGKGVFSGYYKDPEKTRETIGDGWCHTGDAGYLNDVGHLVFLDRAADLVELKTGAKYAPQYIEGRLRFSPYIKDAMVLGSKERDYVGAIVNIDFDNVGKWAEEHRLPYTTFVDLSQKPDVAELVRREVERVNNNLPELARLKKYVLLHKEFDPDEAELTRTRKLRRSFMEQRYADIIDAIYTGKQELQVEAAVTYRDGRKGVVSTALKVLSV